jgi:hypothetical protein
MRLALALYAEGNTDYRFLPLIIQRTSRQILAEHKRSNVNVDRVEAIRPLEKGPTREENILQAARLAHRYQALIIHADADDKSSEKALNERIMPGVRLVQQSNAARCEKLLPLIPIQAIEAWMLADYKVLCAEMRTDLTARMLGIPEKSALVESISKPKLRLIEAIAKANKQRRPHQKIDISTLYEPLGQKIRLERLKQLDAYKEFEVRLTQLFIELDLIAAAHRT